MREGILSLPLKGGLPLYHDVALPLPALSFPLRTRGDPADWTFIPALLESPLGWVGEHFLELALQLVLGLKLPKVRDLGHFWPPQHSA